MYTKGYVPSPQGDREQHHTVPTHVVPIGGHTYVSVEQSGGGWRVVVKPEVEKPHKRRKGHPL